MSETVRDVPFQLYRPCSSEAVKMLQLHPHISLNLLQKCTETNTLHSPKAPLPNMVRKKSLECTSRDNQYAGDFEIEVKWLQKLFL